MGKIKKKKKTLKKENIASQISELNGNEKNLLLQRFLALAFYYLNLYLMQFTIPQNLCTDVYSEQLIHL